MCCSMSVSLLLNCVMYCSIQVHDVPLNICFSIAQLHSMMYCMRYCLTLYCDVERRVHVAWLVQGLLERLVAIRQACGSQ